MKVEVHPGINQHPILVPDVNSSAQRHINHHGALEQRQQGPLMVIIVHMAIRPSVQKHANKAPHLLPYIVMVDPDTRIANPVRIRPGSKPESAKLSHGPGDRHRDGGGEHQPRGTAESALCNGVEGGIVVPVAS